MGVNIAERVPIMIPNCALALCCHTCRRSLLLSPECNIPTSIPKRYLNLCTVCGVSPISGTKISTCLPCLSTCSIAWRYTSVFPLPVIPSNKKQLYCSSLASIQLIAMACSTLAIGLSWMLKFCCHDDALDGAFSMGLM